MAWQLIYTSAPRLLEAGRSGFGTVARHRAIHPLLVTAIERDSQFDRSAGGVVLAHRILTAAGSRFHVLTCIRDAGADYTGRTNHIAHHLVIEPREIAALGAAAPTPADVLAQMDWCQVWSASARWLDGTDEISLHRFHRQFGGTSAWKSATGEALHATLLQPSRSACLILPPGADALSLFAESLECISAQAWQATFTSSLHTGDEPGDFHWLAIAATSPLRASVENGRRIFDLNAPHTLPIPAKPVSAAAAIQSAPDTVSVLRIPVLTSLVTAPAKAAGLFDRRFAVAQRPARRSHAVLWLSIAALAAAIAAGVCFFRNESNALTRKREEIRSAVNTAFSGESTDAAKLGDVPADKLTDAQRLADAVRKTAEELSRRALTPARKQANAEARTNAKQGGFNVPPAVNQLFDFHAKFVGHETALLTAASSADFDSLAKFAEDKNGNPPGKPTEDYRANFLSRLGTQRKEREPRKLVIGAPVEKPKNEKSAPPEKPAPTPPAIPEAVPVGKPSEGGEFMILLPSDNSAWSSFTSKLRESGGELRWHKEGSKPGLKLTRSDTGYRVGAGDAVFLLDKKTKVLTPTPGACPPYELAILKGESRLVVAWVPEEKVPFYIVEGGIKKEGSNFRITDPEALNLLRAAKRAGLKVEFALPKSASPYEPPEIHQLSLSEAGVADATKLKDGLERRIASEKSIEDAQMKVADPTRPVEGFDAALKAVHAFGESLTQNVKKEDKIQHLDLTVKNSLRDWLKIFGGLDVATGEGLFKLSEELSKDKKKVEVVILEAASEAKKETDRWKGRKGEEPKDRDAWNKKCDKRAAQFESLAQLLSLNDKEKTIRSIAKEKANKAKAIREQLEKKPLFGDLAPNGEYLVNVKLKLPENAPSFKLLLFKVHE